jgi:DNA-binding beta-propeller fold protein YncE
MAAGVAIDIGGTLYVTSSLHNSVVKITPDGTLRAFVGGGPAGFRDGKGADAQFFMPEGIAVDAQGNLYVADKFNHRIRKVSPEGAVSTLAGTGEAGHHDGSGTQAQFSSPSGVALDKTAYSTWQIRPITAFAGSRRRA